MFDVKITACKAIFKYFDRWGKDIREICFDWKASGDLYIIPMYCTKLVSVSFFATEPGLAPLFRTILCCSPSIQEIMFEHIRIEPCLIQNMTLPRLQTLYYIGGKLASNSVCREMSQISDKVTRLCLAEVEIEKPDSICEFITPFKDLRTLNLSRTNVDSATMTTVTQMCPRLVNLALHCCENITDVGILSIAQNLVELRTLDIRGCRELSEVTAEHLLQHCTVHLTMLYFNIDVVWDETTTKLLQKFTSLHTLGLEYHDKNSYAVEADLHEMFNALSRLQRLQLHGVGLIADHILRYVGRHCKSLQAIELRPVDDHLQWENEGKEYFSECGLLALQKGCPQLSSLLVYKNCPLLKNKLAIALWQQLKPGLSIIDSDYLDYDAMKCDI